MSEGISDLSQNRTIVQPLHEPLGSRYVPDSTQLLVSGLLFHALCTRKCRVSLLTKGIPQVNVLRLCNAHTQTKSPYQKANEAFIPWRRPGGGGEARGGGGEPRGVGVTRETGGVALGALPFVPVTEGEGDGVGAGDVEGAGLCEGSSSSSGGGGGGGGGV